MSGPRTTAKALSEWTNNCNTLIESDLREVPEDRREEVRKAVETIRDSAPVEGGHDWRVEQGGSVLVNREIWSYWLGQQITERGLCQDLDGLGDLLDDCYHRLLHASNRRRQKEAAEAKRRKEAEYLSRRLTTTIEVYQRGTDGLTLRELTVEKSGKSSLDGNDQPIQLAYAGEGEITGTKHWDGPAAIYRLESGTELLVPGQNRETISRLLNG